MHILEQRILVLMVGVALSGVAPLPLAMAETGADSTAARAALRARAGRERQVVALTARGSSGRSTTATTARAAALLPVAPALSAPTVALLAHASDARRHPLAAACVRATARAPPSS